MNSLLILFLSPALAWLTAEQMYEDSIPTPPPTEEQFEKPVQGNLPQHAPGKDPQGNLQTETTQAAIQWLALLDGQQWGPSWLGAGSLLRDVVSQNQWIDAMKGQRGNLGSASSRKFLSVQQKKQLQYGTRGDFAVVQYQTTFAKQSHMTETVTLMTDGRLKQWKVVSYSITKQ